MVTLLPPLLALSVAFQSAPLQIADIQAQLENSGKVELVASGVLIERANFEHQGSQVEAIVVRPATAGTKAALLLVPGHSRTAIDMLPQAIRFARAGFATIAVTQPGYGGSTGPADFVGPTTFAVLEAAAKRFAAESYVDPARMGVYGYSRGALAAAELAARTDLFHAAVLGGGIYDFQAAYDQIGLAGIKANMEAEAGLDPDAVRFRSPIHDMDGLDGPVLIIHGTEDANAPPAQATALADRLKALGREHQLILVPGKDHALGMTDIVLPAVEFFRRHLAGS